MQGPLPRFGHPLNHESFGAGMAQRTGSDIAKLGEDTAGLAVPKTSFIIEMLPALSRVSMERIVELTELLQGRLVQGTPYPLTGRRRP